jgi:hypothetical protein
MLCLDHRLHPHSNRVAPHSIRVPYTVTLTSLRISNRIKKEPY